MYLEIRVNHYYVANPKTVKHSPISHTDFPNKKNEKLQIYFAFRKIKHKKL